MEGGQGGGVSFKGGPSFPLPQKNSQSPGGPNESGDKEGSPGL